MTAIDFLKARVVLYRREIVLGVSAAVLLVLIVLTVGRMRELACRKELIRAGFPDSYAVRLAPLLADHSVWRFVPLRIDDMGWDAVVDKECTASWNLVPYSTWAPKAWEQYGVTNYTP